MTTAPEPPGDDHAVGSSHGGQAHSRIAPDLPRLFASVAVAVAGLAAGAFAGLVVAIFSGLIRVAC